MAVKGQAATAGLGITGHRDAKGSLPRRKTRVRHAEVTGLRPLGLALAAQPDRPDCRGPLAGSAPFCVAETQIRAYIAPMHGFIYFNITDHARLPARFFGMTRSVLARL